MTHRPGLDQLRGIAVAMVVAGHLLGTFYKVTAMRSVASAGVLLFFTLSGYLAVSMLTAERARAGTVALGRYLTRRAIRLYPALIAALPLLCYVVATDPAGSNPTRLALDALTWTTNYTGSATSGAGHLWSLAVEVHWYVLVGLAAATLQRRHLAYVLLALVAIAAASRAIPYEPWFAYSATHTRIDALALGGLLALAPPSLLERLRPALLILGLPLYVLALGGFTINPALLIPTLGATLLLAAATTTTRRRPRLEHLGHISYGVYLWHLPLGWITARYGPTANTFAVVLGGLIAGHLSHRYLEEPLRRALTRRHPSTIPHLEPNIGEAHQAHTREKRPCQGALLLATERLGTGGRYADDTHKP